MSIETKNGRRERGAEGPPLPPTPTFQNVINGSEETKLHRHEDGCLAHHGHVGDNWVDVVFFHEHA